ncbi:endonuclease-reverse transcriptase [Plakobranchus ocellatus]|uniref:Endonuclease-reverse transcriptase n=1 Tax=Plakobranchus ocellatus TaxID=259542 RepID=A0AAV3ZG14_9GAST|nr:endonuclease-reverse transcriptase [Plakobranchus ocellatus]
MSIFLYACESWTLNADIERRTRAMEMRCYRRLLGISYKDHTTNEEVNRRIENAIGPHVDLLTIVRQRKLKWYGHTTRSSGLAKTIMQGTVNGGRRKGRQKKRWDDNIREWTELELRNTLRKAEDREEWKAVVRRSSAAPRRIPDLRDRVLESAIFDALDSPERGALFHPRAVFLAPKSSCVTGSYFWRLINLSRSTPTCLLAKSTHIDLVIA